MNCKSYTESVIIIIIFHIILKFLFLYKVLQERRQDCRHGEEAEDAGMVGRGDHRASGGARTPAHGRLRHQRPLRQVQTRRREIQEQGEFSCHVGRGGLID